MRIISATNTSHTCIINTGHFLAHGNLQLDMFHVQRDHVRIAVKDALSRYVPAVPEEYYKVSSDCVFEETEFEQCKRIYERSYLHVFEL